MSHRLRDPKYLAFRARMNGHVLDSSGYGNNGTWTGTEQYATFFKGSKTCADFDQASDVDFGDEIVGAGAATVTAWINLDDFGENGLGRICDNGNFDVISPKLIVIMLGTNNAGHNTPGEVAEAMGLIVKRLREKIPATQLLLLGIFPRGFKADDPLRAANTKANAEFSKLADDKWVHYLDVGREFLAQDGTISPEIMPDGLHPTARGYAIWAPAIEAKVTELLDKE